MNYLLEIARGIFLFVWFCYFEAKAEEGVRKVRKGKVNYSKDSLHKYLSWF